MLDGLKYRKEKSLAKRYESADTTRKGSLDSVGDWFMRRGESAYKNLPNYDKKLGFESDKVFDFSGLNIQQDKKKAPVSDSRKVTIININIGTEDRRDQE